MGAFSFKVEGFREIEAALLDIRKVRTRKNALTRAMVDAAQPMADKAQSMAPSSKRVGTEKNKKLKATIAVGTKLSRRQKALAEKEPDVLYVHIGPAGGVVGIAQEFGTINHPPHPFMRPAWERDNRAMLERLAEALRKEVFASLKRQK